MELNPTGFQLLTSSPYPDQERVRCLCLECRWTGALTGSGQPRYLVMSHSVLPKQESVIGCLAWRGEGSPQLLSSGPFHTVFWPDFGEGSEYWELC